MLEAIRQRRLNTSASRLVLSPRNPALVLLSWMTVGFQTTCIEVPHMVEVERVSNRLRKRSSISCLASCRNGRRMKSWTISKHGHTWTNDHQKLRVFSATCQKAVSDRTPNRALPCESCQSVLSSKGFRAALRKPTPSPENQIYINTKYRNQVLGEIYGRHIGLKDIIEAPVRSSYFCERFVLILSK